MPASTLAKTEPCTPEESAVLEPWFSNTDRPIFVLKGLPEVVKGALFARYSRSSKSLRRLFLDEFLGGGNAPSAAAAGPGLGRADELYGRMLGEYGDDSVAQLGGAHLACEGVSNVLTKVLERGRLMSYLEQSTRFVPFTARPDGKWKYVVPGELEDEADRAKFTRVLDHAFETYARWIDPMQQWFRRQFPRADGDPEAVHRKVIRAKALDALRGLLPAATRANVGIYGSGQAYEALLLRMRANPLAESREVAVLMLAQLRTVIPAFLQRVDRPDRGGRWSEYLRDSRQEIAALAREWAAKAATADAGAEAQAAATTGSTAEAATAAEAQAVMHAAADDAAMVGTTDAAVEEVILTDFDPDAEIKVVAAALYPDAGLPHDRLLRLARDMTTEDRIRVLRTYVGRRRNRRHRPGRAFEHAVYNFDVLSDYGAFRDLQRHRMLTIDWQPLTTRHGSVRPAAIDELGADARSDWNRVMDESAELCEQLTRRWSVAVAQYAVSMAYRSRYYLRLNAREAMHIIELRTTPQGHPAYRRVCQRMHKLIAEQAGHTAIAAAIKVDHSSVDLGRLDAERASAARRAADRSSVGA